MRILHSAQRSTSRLLRFLEDESGVVFVEFSFVAPILILVMFAAIIWTWALTNYATLYLAAGVGAQVMSTERLNSTSSSWTPYTDTVNAITGVASNLNQTTLKANIVVSINSTTCATNAACETLLEAVTTTNSTVTPTAVTLSYPCDPITLSNPFTILWVSIGTCTFTATITGVVE